MAKDCWCNLAFHLPGEKKRHKRAEKKAEEMMRILEEIKERSK